MAMTKFEKVFVNRERKADRNIGKVRTRLEQLDVENLHDVLELGCGIGSVSAYLSENYQMNVIGTDFDPLQVQIAKRNHLENERLKYKIEDASHLSFEDGSFDLVLSQNVFHHVHAWNKAVHEVARVLKDGGYFIWLDLVFPKFVVKLFQSVVKNYGLYTYEDIKTEFLENRFEIIYQEETFFSHHVVFRKGE